MRILLVTSRYPWPPRRGDQLRAVQWLELLSTKHEVTLLSPRPERGQPAPEGGLAGRVVFYRRSRTAAVVGVLRALLRGLPLQSGLFFQPDLGRRLRRLAVEHDVGVLQLARLAFHVEDFGALPLVVDLIDSLALSVARRAAVDRAWLRPLLLREAHALERAERRLAERAAALTLVSERDRRHLAHLLPPELAAKLGVVGLVVEPRDVRAVQPDEPPRLALTGNLGYFVNRDAVVWWLAEVWPQLAVARPEVRLVVAGDRPGRAVTRAVERAGPRVELVAAPSDLSGVLERAAAALAPLRCGAGVPVKILEAWAAGVPVVASPWAAAGAAAQPGHELLVADRPDDWVAAVGALLDDRGLRARLAGAGRARLALDCSRAVVQSQLDRAIPAVPDQSPSAKP